MAVIDSSEAATRHRAADTEHQLPPAGAGTRGAAGTGAAGSASIVGLIRDLADDTRTLIQQEIQLAKLEATETARRVVVDSAWIGAGAGVVAVGGLCLVLALALGLGSLLGSYWLGTLITGAILVLAGALIAWKGIRDLQKGGFAPTETVQSLQSDKDWAAHEVDEFKTGIQRERA